jgi:hypothetical protein
MQERNAMNRAYRRLERLSPPRLAKFLHWLQGPRARPVRLPLGILCIVASCFWFLPVIGLEYFPIGLLLLAHDVPVLRRPAGRLMLWMLDSLAHLKRRLGNHRLLANPAGSAPETHRSLWRP